MPVPTTAAARMRINGVDLRKKQRVTLVHYKHAADGWTHELTHGQFLGRDDEGLIVLDLGDHQAAFNEDVWQLCTDVEAVA